ncbi:MAG: hypothetical protein WD407_08010 [Rhodospirillales bacterium]
MKMVQVLKALVIGMGILIVIGMGVLGYGLYKQAQELDAGGARSSSVSPSVSSSAPSSGGGEDKTGFGEAVLPIPAGCEIAEVKPDGDRLYVIIGPAPSCARIVIVDPKSGKIMGTLKAAP